MKTKQRVHFFCGSCGGESPKWAGQCPACGLWNTLAERREPVVTRAPRRLTEFSSVVEALSAPRADEAPRRVSGIGEFDRVLGGGVCPGSLILLGGAPGIGKSTLMLQAADRLATPDHTVLYVSGEESPGQVKSRAVRLGIKNDSLLLLSETDVEKILETVDRLSPGTVVLDSVQTLNKAEVGGAPGSVSQIRECAAEFLNLAKGQGINVFLLGHVTKDGDLAGPRVLEHMVDTVLYFETERRDVHRVLRAIKNRFGPTNEIAVFEMTGRGLLEVGNPSALFLGQHEGATPPGTAVTAVMEGTRPLLVEVQALTTRTLFGMPRRQTSGLDYNRAVLLIAVLDKRCGFDLSSQDVYVNATGGLDVREPDVDLAVAAAMASASLDKALSSHTLWLGEVGLGGELRPVPQLAERLAEARRLGFTRAVVSRGARRDAAPAGLELVEAASLSDALSRAGLTDRP